MINERLPTVMCNLSRKLRINSALVDFNYDSKRAAMSLVVKSVLQMDKKCSLMVSSFSQSPASLPLSGSFADN